MDSGKVWRNHSTTDHEQVFTEELTKKGGELLECIITGGLALGSEDKVTPNLKIVFG